MDHTFYTGSHYCCAIVNSIVIKCLDSITTAVCYKSYTFFLLTLNNGENTASLRTQADNSILQQILGW